MFSKTGNYQCKTAIALLVVLFLSCFPFLLSRYYYQSGLTHIKDLEFEAAQRSLDKALSLLPFRAVLRYITLDEQRISAASGKNHFQKASHTQNFPQAYKELRTALFQYQKATQLNRYDFNTAMGLARTVSALGLLYVSVKPAKANPYHADPYFQRALSLRPNSVTLHYLYCNYLASSANEAALEEQLAKLIAIYPNMYFQLSKESYYKKRYNKAVKDGLQSAVIEGTWKRDAYRAISALALTENDIKNAHENYKIFLSLSPIENTDMDIYKYGQILMQEDEMDSAISQFIMAIGASSDKDNMIKRIFSECTRSKQYAVFVALGERAQKSFSLSGVVDILVARCLAKAGQLELAIARLTRVNDRNYEEEKFYYLAVFNEQLKNWDQMEIYSQKAISVSPKKAKYYSLFARALDRQKKYSLAEGAMDEAIVNSSNENCWLYNQRGWIYWEQQNYSAALKDWQKANTLKPEQASFSYQSSLACSKLGKTELAEKYAKDAVEKAPENETYLKRLHQFE